MTPKPRNAILISGMHRSGTSALARILNLLGADAGSGLLPAVRGDNDSGYWELREIVALNNECLEHFGLSWRDPGPMPEDWLGDPWLDGWRERAGSLIRREFPDTALFLIKDPRLSRLLPVWREVLERGGIQPAVIIMLRHPLEVVASLLRRPNARMSAFQGHRLWLRYLADAEVGSRDLPRAWVRYDHLLLSGRETLEKISQQLQLVWPNPLEATMETISKHLDSNMRHHLSQRQVANRQNLAIDASCTAYEAIVACVDSGRDPGAALAEIELALGELSSSSDDYGQQDLPREQQLANDSGSSTFWMPQEFLRLQSRLYFRSADGIYSPEHSAMVEARADGDELVASFILPDGARHDFVRFDPSELAGVYRIEHIVADGRRLRLDDHSLAAVRDRKLPNANSELVRFACTDGDPWLEIDLRDQGLGPVHELVVHFRRESVLDLVREPLERKLDVLKIEQQRQAALSRSLAHTLDQTREQSQSTRNAACAAYLAQVARHANSRGWGAQLTIAASTHLEMSAQIPGHDIRVWSATGDDPNFQLHLPRGRSSLRPGWYVMSVVLNPLSGRFNRPMLYVDYGDGLSEDHRIPLLLGENTDRHRLLLKFEEPVRALRLDPSDADQACDFLFASPSLRRISRVEAMLRMAWPAVQRMRAQDATWWRIAQEMWSSLRHGPANALNTLHANTRIADGISEGTSYADWIKTNDTLDDAQRALIRADIDTMVDPPLISILLPVYNTPERWLRACLNSVLRQLYPHWELCIADDASTEPHVRSILQQYSAGDPRIKVTYRKKNGHISAASNSALKLATGSFIALLDHDDELPPHALYYVAKSIGVHPDVAMIYSDEDKIDEDGIRFDPYLKPDWNLELFRGHNMFSHLGVYRRSLVVEIGGFREGYEGSQDYDLALRCSERVTRSRIHHIPRILYHWRAIAGSTAYGPQEKNYAHLAARKAISAHLQRVGVTAEVLPIRHRAGNWRIRRLLSPPQPRVSIIVPTRNKGEVLRCCLESILNRSTYPNFEILVVDNRSDDPSTLSYLETLRGRKNLRLISFDEPFNYSLLNNAAVAQSSGDIVVFLNNDTEVITPSWLEEMVSLALPDTSGAVGAMLYYPDDRIQHAGIVLGLGAERVAGHAYHSMPRGFPGDKCRAHLVQEVSAVTGACMAIRRDRFNAVHGFDESLGLAFNDVDLCLRLREEGFHNIWTPNAELYHHESLTRGADTNPEHRQEYLTACSYMRERWGSRLLDDPYYHPALSLDRGDFHTWVTPRQPESA